MFSELFVPQPEHRRNRSERRQNVDPLIVKILTCCENKIEEKVAASFKSLNYLRYFLSFASREWLNSLQGSFVASVRGFLR